MAKRREDFFGGKCCVECGSTDKLELDHINPEDKTTHRIWSWSEVRRNEELAKCQVLCESCHEQKSIQQFKDSYTYLADGECKQGHDLSLVGFYESSSSGKSRKGCSYCHHISRSIARGTRMKTLDEWIAFRSK